MNKETDLILLLFLFSESTSDARIREGIVVKVFSASCMVTFPDVARVETLTFEKLTPLNASEEEEEPEVKSQPRAEATLAAQKTVQTPAAHHRVQPPLAQTPVTPHATTNGDYRHFQPQAQPAAHVQSPAVTPSSSVLPTRTPPRGLALEDRSPLQGLERKILLSAAAEKLKDVDIGSVQAFTPKRK